MQGFYQLFTVLLRIKLRRTLLRFRGYIKFVGLLKVYSLVLALRSFSEAVVDIAEKNFNTIHDWIMRSYGLIKYFEELEFGQKEEAPEPAG
jgi:hypothetical protein